MPVNTAPAIIRFIAKSTDSHNLRTLRTLRIHVGMERKTPATDFLLGKTKQRLLSAVLLQPNRAWCLSELARHRNVPPSSLQRKLALFVDAGIFAKRHDGNRVHFQAEPTPPFSLTDSSDFN